MIVVRKEIVPVDIEVEGKALGRHIHWDPRSKQYRVMKVSQRIGSRVWVATNEDALNQGGLGACCGFSEAQTLNSMGMKLGYKEAVDLYALATTKDEFEGSYPPKDTGSSTLGVMKAAKQLGYIKSYTHCFSLDDVLHGLQNGPGIAGVTWYEGYDSPDEHGTVVATGKPRGGHEISIIGCDTVDYWVYFRTSWGPEFGITWEKMNGVFRMSYSQAQAALFTNGDAGFPIR